MHGKEVTLHLSTDGGTTYGAAFASVTDIQPGAVTREILDNPEYGTGDDWKRKDYGLLDGGEMTFVIKYLAGQTDVESVVDAQINGTKIWMQRQYPAPINKTKSACYLVSEVGDQTPHGEHMKRSIKVAQDGPLIEGVIT